LEAAEFTRALKELFGPHYRLPAAEWLGTDEKTIRRWRDGQWPVPKVYAKLIELALVTTRRRDQ
jgi:hypothetical protein